MKSLPLHHSQRLIKDSDEYADFGLYLSPTYDFVMKLQQYGSMIEVLRPGSLIWMSGFQPLRLWVSGFQPGHEATRSPDSSLMKNGSLWIII